MSRLRNRAVVVAEARPTYCLGKFQPPSEWQEGAGFTDATEIGL